MKIARTIESFFPFASGPANQARMISGLLEKKGISSPIYTTYLNAEEALPEEIFDEKVSVKRFRDKGRLMKFVYTPGLYEELRRDKPDIIHSHSYRSYQTRTAFRFARKNNIPFVLSSHASLYGYMESVPKGIGWLPYLAYDFFSRKEEALLADAIIVNTVTEKKKAIELFGADRDRIHVISVGVEPDRYKIQRRPKNDDEPVILLFFGNISRNRNLEPIIKAMTLIDKRVTLIIAGKEMKSSEMLKGGYVDELKELSQRLGVSGRISFPGPMYDAKKIEMFGSADIFIYTSISENFGQTMIEAGAAGLPIIATPVGIADPSEGFLQDDKTGYVIPFLDNNKKEISQKIIADRVNSLVDRKRRSKIGRNAQATVEKMFNWESIIIEYERLYLELIRKNQKTRISNKLSYL